MDKKNVRRKRDIKSKLLAAICMLLVSSIMMVSSTYAWFTLSTAPEVTGITTAVGANGNLEMALQPLNGVSGDILSGVGNSMYGGTATVYESNMTWGNLVDVSDNNYYGMNNVMLYPAKLNTEEGDANKIAEIPLLTPKYGADGRITALAANTFTGVYDPASKGFVNNLTYGGNVFKDPFGLRAIGTSSGMSDRQLAYRAALSAASTYAGQATVTASQSLNNRGAMLADLAIKHATWDTAKDGTEQYTKTEIQPLLNAVNDLLGYGTGDDHVKGSLEYIEDALIQYALASALATVASDDNYQTYVDAFLGSDTVEGATLDTLADVMIAQKVTNTVIFDGNADDDNEDAIDVLKAAIDNVTTAKNNLETLLAGEGPYTWDQINEPVLQYLANPSSMQVNGIAVQDLKKDWTVEANVYNAGEKITVGEGDAAVTYAKYVVDETTYYVKEVTGGTTTYVVHEYSSKTATYDVVSNMSRLVNAVLNEGLKLIIRSGAGVYADIADFCGDYSAGVTLSEISYGGMKVSNLDAMMSTKTSRDGSEGKGSPYLDEAADAVPEYNKGASTTASTSISDFYGYIIDLAFRTNVAGSDLMLQQDGIDRIYSDGSNTDTLGGGATMSFKSSTTSFTAAQVKNLMGCIRIVFFDTDTRMIIGHARLDAASATTSSDGKITMELRMWDADTNAWAATQKIMALEQNTITELSVMVYLDGEAITNADVANAASSMTGTMNLQFSSSAELDPMDYSDLKNGVTDDSSAKPTTVNVSSITDGYTATVAHASGYVAAVITDTNAAAALTGDATVTINGTNATYNAQAGGWVIAADTAPESVTIVVTPTT